MTSSAEALERRIDELRAAVRKAVTGGERERAKVLRGELRKAERQWEEVLDELAEQPVAVRRQTGPLLPLREQVHQALTLLGAPAAPKLVIAVHEAFHMGEMIPARLTSLRRDEERSFRSAPHSRPYYLCAALTADLLAPARGLLAVSTWPMVTRVIGPLSPRVDFLTSAIRLAEHLDRIPDPGPQARRLLWRFAANIPGAAASADAMTAAAVAEAAEAELEIHRDADRSHREAAAKRAREQLDDVEQLFGSRLRSISAAGS
ncbi:hypothetical protein NLX85_18155 [Micromonospora sp. A3M-1-15]|uniref:hypothetical protein n=1 Tax=Micromonospora sp. A3M-1-15 TaxID=2962035 RepID=UPI0020B7EB8E|nr:hypothetical protein [Micromonospora sp. A3M-1-15]MCP3785291.1 hypothetical protein [Micromonospora sp. A3M-1-15]